MASYRETLGYRGSARVLEPAPGVLHCAPVARVERAE